MIHLKREDIRAFVARPREQVELMKRRHWSSVARDRAEDSVPLAHWLLQHARVTAPSFPPARYAEEDWEHHLHLKGLLDRAAAALDQSDLAPIFERALRRARDAT